MEGNGTGREILYDKEGNEREKRERKREKKTKKNSVDVRMCVWEWESEWDAFHLSSNCLLCSIACPTFTFTLPYL